MSGMLFTVDGTKRPFLGFRIASRHPRNMTTSGFINWKISGTGRLPVHDETRL